MAKKRDSDHYEVGYAKPPQQNQFPKGVSGNPKGRPKKPLCFDQQLLREANTLVTINENGKRVRMPKHEVALRQLANKAMAGDMRAMKVFIGLYQQANGKFVLSAEQQAKDIERRKDEKQLSDEELMEIALTGQKLAEDEPRT